MPMQGGAQLECLGAQLKCLGEPLERLLSGGVREESRRRGRRGALPAPGDSPASTLGRQPIRLCLSASA
jgi:hypothetical protein